MEFTLPAIALSARRARFSWRTLLASPWLRPFNDPVLLDGWLRAVHPTWSLMEVRARIVSRVQETADTWTLVLRPNGRWKGFRPGQHVVVGAPIGGRQVLRCFSLSAASGKDRTIAITVKRPSGGMLSGWLHDRARVGDVLTLGDAGGDFVLPDQPPERLLLLSAGSGITPMRAHLQALRASGWKGDAVLVHACRNRADAIFGDELEAMAREWPSLRLHRHESETAGRLSPDVLAAYVPDLAQRHTLMCGPAGFMATFQAHWERLGCAQRLQVERFAAPRLPDGTDEAVAVRFARSNRDFSASTAEALLPQAEAAGLRPAYGCRAGVCHTCKCRKTAGTVRNLLTGEESSAPDQWIQLCISAPRSTVTLDL